MSSMHNFFRMSVLWGQKPRFLHCRDRSDLIIRNSRFGLKMKAVLHYYFETGLFPDRSLPATVTRILLSFISNFTSPDNSSILSTFASDWFREMEAVKCLSGTG